MGRLLAGALVSVVFFWGVVVCDGAGRAGVLEGQPFWVAPGGTWWIKLLAHCDPASVTGLWRDAEARSVGFKFVRVVVEEPGEWFTVSLKPVKVRSVVFTPRTKMVVYTRDGRVVESEGFFFWPDRVQSQLWESRKRVVVVTMDNVCRVTSGLWPMGGVKFPKGSLRYDEVDSFEVVAAVEQGGDGEAE